MSRVYLLLGSNQGDRAALLAEACDRIGALCGSVTAMSRLYESEPWGFEAETWFVNQALELTTGINPHRLLLMLLDIERELGRRRSADAMGYASRPIDIDMLYYDDLVVDTANLVLPHPRIRERRFALLPMCDVAPDFVHPLSGLTQRELLERCQDNSKVLLLQEK